MKNLIHKLMLTSCLALAGSLAALAQPVATHQANSTYTAGTLLGVTNTFQYSGQMWSLLWRPHLPAGWTIASVSGAGNPELQSGEVVWTGSMPGSPIQMVYMVQVPAGASGTYNLRGEVEYQLAGMVNPASIYANPDPLRVSPAGPVLWTLTVASANPASGVAVSVSPADLNGNANGVTEFTRQYTNLATVTLTAPATAGGNAFQRWEQDGVGVSSNLSTTVTMGANHVLRALYASPSSVVAQHACPNTYTPDGLLGVTNTLSYSGQLWSLLWRPHLPAGWTIASVSGAGNPELQSGEVVWTGTMPASPFQMVYMVQVPAGASGTYNLRGEVEYQLAGMVNPASTYASPDPLVISNWVPVLRTLTVASANPASGVAVSVSPADLNGNANGVTEFTRQYTNLATVTLTAPATAGGNTFQHWEQDGVGVSSNLSTTVTMDANHVLRALYATIGAAPVITAQPQSVTTNAGVAVAFGVTASGTALTYQWRFNGTNAIAGATTSTLTLTNVQPAQAGAYQVVVANTAGAVTSQVASLSILSPTTFQNASAITINPFGPASLYPSTIKVSGQTGVLTKVTATLRGFSHTFPHDVGVLLVGPQGQKVLLQANAGGGQPVANLALTFDDGATAALSEYDPISSGTYKPGGCGQAYSFTAPAPAGPYASTLSTLSGANCNGIWSLYILDTSDGDSGSVVNGWALNLFIDTPPQITQHPTNQTVIAGNPATFSVTATGSGPLSYAWCLNGTPLTDGGRISGAATPNLTLANVQPADAGLYSVVVTNRSGTVSSTPATLTVLPFGTPVFVPGSLRHLSDGQFQFTLLGAAGSNYDLYVSPDLKNWKLLRSFAMPDGATNMLDTTTNLMQRFYRVKLK